ncbi:acetylglutamate kinase [Trichoderma longibrachiatum]|uniref:Acetylglutamate kinase n=1 Tax=Trichoderma longibrachiatum ATCC 18648 TaxID=983965 RepID=A0A2T4C188_TRILO|nr:acetylglutamate kinase [Trichoderma longibrachiatum ATCC 18648]
MLSATSVALRAGARRAVRRSASILPATTGPTRCLAGRQTSFAIAGMGQQRRGYAATTNPNPPLGKKNATNETPSRIGLIGARGYTGSALVELLNEHPYMDLRHVSSRELAGQELKGYTKRKVIYETLSPEDVARLDKDGEVDCWIMALPNGVCQPYVEALDQNKSNSVIVDLSADFRFNDTWTYGLPELVKRSKIAQSRRISNPGCYATGAQIGLSGARDLLDGMPTIFGVSGYSGAGSKPNARNNVEVLKNAIIPYSLTSHVHEREISHHLNHEVAFVPHVAGWFRGITLTLNIPLNKQVTSRDIRQIYQDRYAGEKLIKVVGEPPLVSGIMGRHGVEIGGFAVDSTGKRVVVIVTIDNLAKGASTQCLQNMNLALGYGEFEGIPVM